MLSPLLLLEIALGECNEDSLPMPSMLSPLLLVLLVVLCEEDLLMSPLLFCLLLVLVIWWTSLLVDLRIGHRDEVTETKL